MAARLLLVNADLRISVDFASMWDAVSGSGASYGMTLGVGANLCHSNAGTFSMKLLSNMCNTVTGSSATFALSGKTIAALLMISATPLVAEMAASRTILLAMGMNVKQMMQYEWKQRVTVVRRGTPSEPLIDQVRFDSSGQMQRTTLSAPQQKQMGGIRGRVAAGVKENVKDIMELAGSYNKPQQMIAAVKKAEISQGVGGGTTRLQASNLIQPADSMTMLVNSATHLASHVDIRTSYEGSPMTIAQDYGALPDGPNVMKSMRVSVPQKGLAVNVDSYDFVRQSASARR